MLENSVGILVNPINICIGMDHALMNVLGLWSLKNKVLTNKEISVGIIVKLLNIYTGMVLV